MIVLQWVVIPFLLLAVANYGVRHLVPTGPAWYEQAEINARNQPDHMPDVIFIGSSRVAAAINNEAFDRRMSQLTGRKIVSLNFGQGYSTIQEHYLGMRNLLKRYSKPYKPFTVLIEAPGEMVNIKYYKRWTDDWINNGETQLLVPLLHVSDFLFFLKSSTDKSNDKTYVAFKYLTKSIDLIRYRERTKAKIDRTFKNLLEPPAPKNIAPQPDLTQRGGIKTDPKALEMIRASAVTFANEMLSEQRDFQNWDQTVLADLIRLIESYNGTVVFYTMPASSVYSRVFNTNLHQKNKATFKKQLKKWNIPLLYPEFSYTDEDFPDLWHMKLSRSFEFSEKLADAYFNVKR
ncbi:MAG: hypothetical protein ACM3SY_05535 [Candidatus Omnitrophota bacterium]